MSDPGSAVSPEAAPAGGPAAQASVPPRRRLTDGADLPVLPDCCNLGTMARVLLPLNLGVLLLGWLLPAAGAGHWPMFETALRVDAVAAATLLLLCPLRRAVSGAPRSTQWAVGLGVPAALAAAVALASAAPPQPGVLALVAWLMPRVLLAAAVAWLLIEYLRLR